MTTSEAISKSQRKRDSDALQKLGETLIALGPQQLAETPLPETLREAIETAQALKSHGALRRQRQFIGKLMREIDPAPIQQALEKIENRSAQAIAQLHKLERWRDRLLKEGDSALGDLLQEYPQAERQQLRQLIRTAQREQKMEKPPRAARALFRYLRELTASDK